VDHDAAVGERDTHTGLSSGKKLEEIERAMDRDTFMEADEAKAFGIIDEVFDKRPDQGEDSGTGAGDVTPA